MSICTCTVHAFHKAYILPYNIPCSVIWTYIRLQNVCNIYIRPIWSIHIYSFFFKYLMNKFKAKFGRSNRLMFGWASKKNWINYNSVSEDHLCTTINEYAHLQYFAIRFVQELALLLCIFLLFKVMCVLYWMEKMFQIGFDLDLNMLLIYKVIDFVYIWMGLFGTGF